MEIYLIRHGIAEERGQYDRDEERPLTAKGKTKTRAVAHKLKELGLGFDTLFTSPLVRATQTADMFKEAHLTDNIKITDNLCPNGSPRDWWTQDVRSLEGLTRVAAVGHQPDLGHWAEILVWGHPLDRLVLKKAGVLGLQVPTTHPEPWGVSELLCLIPPRFLGLD